MVKMIPMMLFTIFLPFLSFLKAYEMTTGERIGYIVKSSLSGLTDDDVNKMMISHWQKMQLMNSEGNWANKRLDGISPVLNSSTSVMDLVKLVDEMVENASKNKYLHLFLEQARGPDFSEIIEKVETEGALVFPDVVTYAMVMHRLTKAMRNDWKILEACKDIWTSLLKPFKVINSKSRVKRTIFKESFIALKAFSIQHAAATFIEVLKKGEIDPELLKWQLPINIGEAKALDIFLGNLANARVAIALAKSFPTGEENSCTGSKPAKISSDGNGIEINMDFPGEWADLYQTWNMAFVTNFNTWPYVIVKLLIPNITDYHSNPGSYLYERVLGLYTHINYFLMDLLHGNGGIKEKINWLSISLSRNWGRANLEAARKYENLRDSCSL